MTDFGRRWNLPLGAAALFLALALAYAFSLGIRATNGASITGDEPFYLLTTRSLLEDGDLDLRNQYDARSYEAFFDHPDGLWKQSMPSRDGRLLSPHNPGLSVLLVPGFALETWPETPILPKGSFSQRRWSMFCWFSETLSYATMPNKTVSRLILSAGNGANGFPARLLGGLTGAQAQLLLTAAATMALAFVLATRLTGRSGVSWLAALGVGLSAVAFVHSTEVYPEIPAALALTLSLLVVTKKERPTLLDAVWAAAALSAMCWLGVKYAPLAALVSAYFLFRADGPGRATLVGLGCASAALFFWFHLETFGSLTPYSVNVVYSGQSTVEVFGRHFDFGDRLYRLWGLFVDRRFGVGRWAPLLLVAIPGLVLLGRRGSPHRLVLGLIGAQVLIATFVAITMMGWWFPGRTLMTVLPLFALPLVLAVAAAPSWARATIALLAAYGVTITAGLAHAGHSGEVKIAVDPFDMGFPPFQAVHWLFPDYRVWTLETWALTVLWLALAGLAFVLAAPPARRYARRAYLALSTWLRATWDMRRGAANRLPYPGAGTA